MPDRMSQPKVLTVVAHPDDEYAFAATLYRMTHDLDSIVDQVVITNGEGGYRYSALAEAIYRVPLTRKADGRANLPSIRRIEALRAGEILGIRQTHFLNQPDAGFEDDPTQACTTNWDRRNILSTLVRQLQRERYDFVFTLLPVSGTHSHHCAATLLVLEAISHLPETERPAVLGADPGTKYDDARYIGLPSTLSDTPALSFDRTTPFGYRDALNYQIIVNWVIAEHKSQGLFQTEYGRHDVEHFWLFTASGSAALSRTMRLADQLTPRRWRKAVA